MGYIYKMTNKVNNKCYIGLTIRSVKRRIKQHYANAYNINSHQYDTLLGRAIRKYGQENFEITILGEYDNEILPQKQKSFIKQYDSFNPNVGYNLTLGGEGNQILDHDQIIAIWKEPGLTLSDLEIQLKISRNTIHNILINNGISQADINRRKGIHCGTKIAQYDKFGNLIKKYNSVVSASRQNHLSRSAISNCLTGRAQSCGNFLWKYV